MTAAREVPFTRARKERPARKAAKKIARRCKRIVWMLRLLRLDAELLQHAARPAAVGDDARSVRGTHAVDPHAVQAHRGRVEARGARGQVVHAPFLATTHRGGIEEQ